MERQRKFIEVIDFNKKVSSLLMKGNYRRPGSYVSEGTEKQDIYQIFPPSNNSSVSSKNQAKSLKLPSIPSTRKFKKSTENPAKTTNSWYKEKPKRIQTTNKISREDSESHVGSSPMIISTKRSSKTDSTSNLDKKEKRIPKHREDQANKHREQNLDVLLKNKSGYDFEMYIQEYIRRQGLPENSKIFQLTGQFEYIRRAFVRRGWVENKNLNSHAFHLKWTLSDSEQDYKHLKAGQLFNHIANNRELTTKSGLCRSLRQFIEYGVNVNEFFPRCYDLGDNFQIKELRHDYLQASIINIVRSHALHFEHVETHLKVDIELLIMAIHYCYNLFEDLTDGCERTRKYSFMKEPHRDFSLRKEQISELMAYSEIPFPFRKEDQKNHWDFPSETIVQQTIAVSKQVTEILPHGKIEGLDKIWIIKPGQNARGSGVRCVKGLKEIIDAANQMQARVVQKYVECPLLLPLSNGLCKFDIRQWVLVTSFNPLTVYFYNSNYSRLCQLPFSLSNLDASRHLANFSVQKSNTRNLEDTVWPLSQLKRHLSSLGCSWEGQVLPKVHYLVIKTLESVADSMEDKTGCFELYGFDIILDEDFIPWLLEVNLSPACAERTPWITSMLDSMADGMLDILVDGAKHSPLYSKNMEKNTVDSEPDSWALLYLGEQNPSIETKNYLNLEIFGEKFNVRKEKQIEKRFNMQMASFIIQKQIRKFLEKRRQIRRRERELSLIIQNCCRRKFAWDYAFFVLKVKSAVKIQSQWRRTIAQRQLNMLRFEKAVILVQAHIKGLNERSIFKRKKIDWSCKVIQRGIKRFFSVLVKRKEQKYIQSVKTIQRAYLNRYNMKNSCAMKVQKAFRGYRDRKLCKREKHRQHQILVVKKTIRKFFAIQLKQKLLREKSIRTIALHVKASQKLKGLTNYQEYRSCRVVQNTFRRYLSKISIENARTAHNERIKGIEKIQSYLKMAKLHKDFRNKLRNRAALLIQKNWKGYIARDYYYFLQVVHRAATMIQKWYRGFKARRKFQMAVRAKKQEVERKKRMVRMRVEKEKRAKNVSDRLFNKRNVPIPPTKIDYKALDKPKIIDSINLDILEKRFNKERETPKPKAESFITDSQIIYLNEYSAKPKKKSKKKNDSFYH